MKFRTEIEPQQGQFRISHDDHIVMLGSCFTDSIGEQLTIDGFDVVSNPMGPLYNPLSIAKIIERGGRPYTATDLIAHDGTWHCLDFANKYSDVNADALLSRVNSHYLPLYKAIEDATVVIITFGSARVFEHTTFGLVGNCHKIPAANFTNREITIVEIVSRWAKLLNGKRVIFTISPIRYLAYGMTANSLSKATLRMAIDQLCQTLGCDYFPSYEIMIDDLRDYRFYAADMKHPSEVAVNYIYEIFANAYFDESTIVRANIARKDYIRSQHRTINN